METTQKRQKSHEYIESDNDEKVNALFLIIESGEDASYPYSAEDIKMFYERRERYLNGERKNYSKKELFEEMRKRKLFK
jgi:hypothetical protein